jgi:hypothetical protein
MKSFEGHAFCFVKQPLKNTVNYASFGILARFGELLISS